MEQENQQKERNGGGNHSTRRPRHRGGRRPNHSKPQGAEARTPAETTAVVNASPAPSNAPKAQNLNKATETTGGNGNGGGNARRHHRSRGGRGRGERPTIAPETTERQAEATRKEEKQSPRANERAPKEPAKEFSVSPTLNRTSEDRWLDDTFSPLHEVEIHDPDAEAAATARLDAEGPLLSYDRPEEMQEAEDERLDEELDIERVEIVGVRFKTPGKVYFFAPNGNRLSKGSYAIVETTRGPEYGEVALSNTLMPAGEIVQPLRPVLRAATKEDSLHQAENKQKEEEAFRVCQSKIASHGLDMKLVEAQYTFDNSKLLFYFTSDGRVDFRDLVKDLAGVFRTRIELRQIGIRDEAKLLGGLGACGRTLCCAGFLPDFVQVSIKMAKEQNLSLNSTKISGACGRLMCCLRYEHETYEEEIRRTPAVDSVVETPDGAGLVISNHPLKGTVTVRLTEHTDEPPKVYHRDTVKVLRQRGERTLRDKRAEHSDEEESSEASAEH